jgi:hypothetical protein
MWLHPINYYFFQIFTDVKVFVFVPCSEYVFVSVLHSFWLIYCFMVDFQEYAGNVLSFLMATKERPVAAPKKPALTPKAIIHQKFGKNACYVVEEVKEVFQTECPGLSIPQTGPSLYRCTLQLPKLTVESGTFKKKKDAEQSAAEMAIEKVLLISNQ